MFFESDSMNLSVETVSSLFARWAEKDGDIQLSCQFFGVCLLFFVRSVPPGVGDSFMLRRFAVSAGRATFKLRYFRLLYCFVRASSTELRLLLVMSAFWRFPVTCVWVRSCFVGLRHFLVPIAFQSVLVSTPFVLFEFAGLFCLLVVSFVLMCALLIYSKRCSCDLCFTAEV